MGVRWDGEGAWMGAETWLFLVVDSWVGWVGCRGEGVWDGCAGLSVNDPRGI